MQDHLTRAQSQQVDQIAMHEFGIPGIVLMENAARNAADSVWRRLRDGMDDSKAHDSVLILCGGGNNGGDGYAIARHLHNRGVGVRLIAAVPSSALKGDAKVNSEIIRRMSLPLVNWPSAEADDWIAHRGSAVIDALLGTGFEGVVRSPMDHLIAAANSNPARRFAIDVPSGLDCETGVPSPTTIRADLTITFVAKKVGFANAAAHPFLGEVEVVDIGAPPEVLKLALSAS